MKVDYHVHLEEGPYSISFLEETIHSITQFQPLKECRYSKEWMKKMMNQMNRRLNESEYSEWWLDFYLQQALKRGIKEVGIVDHLYRFRETEEYFKKNLRVTSEEIGEIQKSWLDKVMVRRLDEYVDFITSQKEKWAEKGVQLKLGIEVDYFIGGENELQDILRPYEFDYIIGSVHFYDGWGFDNPHLVHKFLDYDIHMLYKNHFETVEKAIESGLFDIIAHLDNLKVYNHRPDESSLIELYQSVARKLKERDVATEINPGLYYRYPVKEMCPSPTFLKILVEENVTFTTSSDSHYPHDLGIYAEKIQKLLVDHDVFEIATFDKRKRTMQMLRD